MAVKSCTNAGAPTRSSPRPAAYSASLVYLDLAVLTTKVGWSGSSCGKTNLGTLGADYSNGLDGGADGKTLKHYFGGAQ